MTSTNAKYDAAEYLKSVVISMYVSVSLEHYLCRDIVYGHSTPRRAESNHHTSHSPSHYPRRVFCIASKDITIVQPNAVAFEVCTLCEAVVYRVKIYLV
jgi:hypothetical protein